MPFSFLVPVTDSSGVGQARRQALRAAELVRLEESLAAEAAIVATEAARNALLHGGGGELIVSGDSMEDGGALQILALDKGPGIRNISAALADGYSTAGTSGTGLGAIQRISSAFDLYTEAGSGTVLFSEINSSADEARPLQIAGVAIPFPGETFCGDRWESRRSSPGSVLLLADGLGHGYGAAEAAEEAARVFSAGRRESPLEIMAAINDALKKTRGAAAFVASIDTTEQKIDWAGVGNISATLFSPTAARNLVSHNGTLGHAYPRLQPFQSRWEPGSILIAHSDGVQSRWDLSRYRGIFARHPAVIAGVLLRDFRRTRDDSSVVVAKSLVR
jgi:anti-sigma regulatory factor (Ser/Thr protein kinase)